jgi:hypothetical protein
MVGAAKRRHLNGSGGELDGRYTAIYRDTRAETTRKVGGKTVGRRREEKGVYAMHAHKAHVKDTLCRLLQKYTRQRHTLPCVLQVLTVKI